MAVIISRATWQRQPSGLLTPDYGRPLAQGLKHWQSGAATERWTSVGGVLAVPSDRGVALNYIRASVQHLWGSLAPDLTGPPLTLMAIVRHASVDATQGYIGLGAATLGGYLIYVDNSERVFLQSRNNTTFGQAQSGASAIATGVWATIVARVSSDASRDLWINGVSVGSNTTNVPSFTVTDLAIGSYYTTGAVSVNGFDGTMAFAGIWNRALTDAEIVEVSRNPWQLFAPWVRRTYVEIIGGGNPEALTQSAAGAYTLTGNAATLTVARVLTQSAAGSYVLTGNAATLSVQRSLTQSAAGSYALTGQTAALTVARVLSQSAAGAYTVTGNAATLTLARVLTQSAAGSYAVTGQTATLTYTPLGAYSLEQSAPGAYTLTGHAATLTVARVLTQSAAGAYVLTGNTATLTYTPLATYSLTQSAPGAYALTGQTATLTVARVLTQAAPGSYSLTGQTATLAVQRALTQSSAGAYALTGQTATLTLARVLPQSAVGTYTLTGLTATLTYSGAVIDVADDAHTWALPARETTWTVSPRTTTWRL